MAVRKVFISHYRDDKMEVDTPNGLIGIILPSKGSNAYLPPRLEENWEHGHSNCYARYYIYPSSTL